MCRLKVPCALLESALDPGVSVVACVCLGYAQSARRAVRSSSCGVGVGAKQPPVPRFDFAAIAAAAAGSCLQVLCTPDWCVGLAVVMMKVVINTAAVDCVVGSLAVPAGRVRWYGWSSVYRSGQDGT